ncbi:hypothetical protein WJX74_006826 [Apatococcus lobatus]|uniref:Glycine--tRNA ligase n=1 Tax=Apatococcus lobatus TaxID=904363 RepID=A0AAW1S7S8_9CHLO
MATTLPDNASLEQDLVVAQAAVTKQGDTVRSLKASLKEKKADKAQVEAAIEQLKNLKASLDLKQKEFQSASGKTSSTNREAFRDAVKTVLERRLFYIPSFEIYGSVAGFYDYGPPGCALKQNFTQFWRQHFVLEESMLEVECPAVTPEVVLKASGHVDRFTDLMVTDVVTGDCHRADHLLEAALQALLDGKPKPLDTQERQAVHHLLATVEELNVKQLGDALEQYGVKAPETNNDISRPFPFNLMFKTSIGPRGDQVGYLRPETAQGIFVNFRHLLYSNGGKLPFAAAQIGQSFRNEISPRAGLLRVREFTQAEIEHFCNPDAKDHPKFQSIAREQPLLFSRALQMSEEKQPQAMQLGDAVSQSIIANQTLAYFIGRTYLFLLRVGINPKRLRFRQHLANEMAHYAEDCWDAEVECSYGWVECVGLADRSAYDLRAHATKSKTDMSAYEPFPDGSRMVDVLVAAVDKREVGKTYKKDGKAITEALESLPEEEKACMQADLAAGKPCKVTVGDAEFAITAAMVQIKQEKKKLTGRNFVPSVIEPSFGVGRIIYCMFEHCYATRKGDEKRSLFHFKPIVAPVKATVFPLFAQPTFIDQAQAVAALLTAAGLSTIVDSTGASIGKRYARTDEIGVPFAVTVDHQTLEDSTVTVRDRDSTTQVRVPIAEVQALLTELVKGRTWESMQQQYPTHASAADDN